MRVGDLVALSPAPLDLVAQLPEAEALAARVERRERADPAALDAWLADWLIASDENRFVVTALLDSLSGQRGGPRAFLVRGVYGTGKTHLLGALRLLATGGPCWAAFVRTHPEFARHARNAKPLFVVSLALDDFDPRRTSLEDLVLGRVRDRLAHLQAPAVGPAATAASRAAVFSELEAAAGAAGYAGIVILLDELGLFLSGRPGDGRNADAGFLQFLGQRAQRSPLWVIAAIQRQLDESGGFDPYVLQQLRDRFRHDMTLSMSNLGAVLRARLRLQRGAAEGMARVHRALGGTRLRFSVDDLRAAYPFNPFAYEVLEGICAQYGSRTRGLLAAVLHLAAPLVERGVEATHLVTAAEVFDDLRPLLETHGDLSRAARAWSFLERNATRIWGAERPASGNADPARDGLGPLAAKALLTAALAGASWSVEELASSLAGREGIAAPPVAAVSAVLEDGRRHGAYLRLQSAEPARYVFDVSDEISQTLRQRVLERMAECTAHDPRRQAAMLAACRDDPFPLGRWLTGRVTPVWWRNTRRPVLVVLSGDETPVEQVAAWCAQSEAPGGDFEAVIAVARPLTRDAGRLAEEWFAQSGDAARRLLVWAPAAFTAADDSLVSEAAARSSLLEDATLAQTRHGRALQARLETEQPEWEAALRRAVVRAYQAGRWWRRGESASARAGESEEIRDGSDIGGSEDSTRHAPLAPPLALESAAEVCTTFEEMYPRFGALAPRRPLASDAGCHLLLDRVFAQGHTRVVPGSTLAAHVSDLLETLGLATLEGPTVTLARAAPVFAALDSIAACADAAAIALEDTVETETALRALAAPPWGIPRALAELVVAAAVRAGHVVGLDGYLRPVPISAVASPLTDYWPRLARTRSLPAATRRRAARAAGALLGELPPSLDAVTDQSAVWERLRALPAARYGEWRDTVARLTATWPRWQALSECITALETMHRAVVSHAFAEAGLTALAATLPVDHELLADRCAWMSSHLAEAVGWHDCLTEAVCPPDNEPLAALREALCARLSQGPEAIAGWTEAMSAAQAWRAAYAEAYAAWHARVFCRGGRDALDTLRAEPATRLLTALTEVAVLRPVLAAAREALEGADAAWCDGADLSERLRVHPRCICGLRHGEERADLDADALQVARDGALAAARDWLRAPDRAARLRRRLGHPAARPLYRALGTWVAQDDSAFLTSALTPEAVALLNIALDGEVAAERPLAALAEVFRGRELSVAAAREVFARWLDPDRRLRDVDLVRME